ncbi:MAG: hypothetical protein CXT64_02040 [Methanobacteriota archaeon]|nr:MAG: hypothetical protein CXT64_02040 [Euryarchaeota archaeon]
MRKRLLAALISTAMLTSMIPVASAGGPSDSMIWGVSYDWANIDDDQITLTGTSPEQVLQDLEDAAMFAKFDLDIISIISGSTYFFVEQWDDVGTTTIEDADGDTHTVTARNTEITMRHGSRNDNGLISYWEDGNETYIDIWFYSWATELAVIDILYTEYVDSQMRIVGADLAMSGTLDHDSEAELRVEVAAGGETISADITLQLAVAVDVPSLTAEWRTHDPVDFYWMMDQDGVSDSNFCYRDSCGMVSGDYALTISYAASVAGIPSENFGFDADAFDISMSDSVTSAGAFFEQFDTAIYTGDHTPSCQGLGYTVDADLGQDALTEVQCRTILPFFSPALLGMGAISLNSVFQDSESFEAVIQEIEYQIESSFNNENETSPNEVFVCDDGTEIPGYWVNDGEEDCPDGSDEMNGMGSSLELIVESLEHSDLGQTIENFFERFEVISESSQGQATLDLEDACLSMLWDPMDAKVLGMVLIDGGMMLIGPDIVGVSTHPVELHLEYLVGDDARAAQQIAANMDTLPGLAPPSEHDERAVRDFLGIEDEGGIFVPAPGILATLALLGATALFKRRDD